MIELEVPEVVVCTLCLRHSIVWFRLTSVDNVWELDRVLYEEHWNVVADNVPIAFRSVMLDGEATDVSNSVCTACTTEHGRESEESRCAASGVRENARTGVLL